MVLFHMISSVNRVLCYILSTISMLKTINVALMLALCLLAAHAAGSPIFARTLITNHRPGHLVG
jgi:hypothetical protein